MKPSIMIDLETLGTRPGCVISSIGACVFDPHSDWIGETLHVHIDLEDSERHGFRIESGTVRWWMAQDNAAREAFLLGQSDSLEAKDALWELVDFIHELDGDPWVWCNGASFDFPILKAYFAKFGNLRPWAYWQEMDLRTLKNLNKGLRLERQGTHHNALDDAIHQARLVQHILQANPDMDA